MKLWCSLSQSYITGMLCFNFATELDHIQYSSTMNAWMVIKLVNYFKKFAQYPLSIWARKSYIASSKITGDALILLLFHLSCFNQVTEMLAQFKTFTIHEPHRFCNPQMSMCIMISIILLNKCRLFSRLVKNEPKMAMGHLPNCLAISLSKLLTHPS